MTEKLNFNEALKAIQLRQAMGGKESVLASGRFWNASQCRGAMEMPTKKVLTEGRDIVGHPDNHRNHLQQKSPLFFC